MFHIDCTFEDTRIVAKPNIGSNSPTIDYWTMQVTNLHSGLQREVTLTATQLGYILAINLDLNGMPEGVDKMYESLEPLFKDWDDSLFPLP
jgi:hypothetical protein